MLLKFRNDASGKCSDLIQSSPKAMYIKAPNPCYLTVLIYYGSVFPYFRVLLLCEHVEGVISGGVSCVVLP